MEELLNTSKWPPRPERFHLVLTTTEAAQFLRLDSTGHTPQTARRTLDYWRGRGQLRGTKYARRVWYLREELERFVRRKTQQE